jgi:hypothetical protein
MYVESERGWEEVGKVFEYIHLVWNWYNVWIEIVSNINNYMYEK